MNKLKEYYQEQLRLYKEMFDIGLDQEKAIQAKDYKRLLLLIKEREKIIGKIDSIREKSFLLSEDIDKEAKDVVKELIYLLRKILTQEKKNESLLKEDMQQISCNLQKIDKVKLLQKAYRGFFQPSARFLDQRK